MYQQMLQAQMMQAMGAQLPGGPIPGQRPPRQVIRTGALTTFFLSVYSQGDNTTVLVKHDKINR